MKVLLLGRHEMLYDTGRLLLAQGRHDICGIITARSSPEYRRTESDFEKLAAEAKVPFLRAQKIDARVLGTIEATRPDIVVSVNWVSIVNEDLLTRVPHGVLNAHLGDLPRYRGNAVPNWALLRGESEVVAKVHSMLPDRLDEGPILARKAYRLRQTTTIRDIIEFASSAVPKLFARALDLVEADRVPRHAKRGLAGAGFRCFPRLPRDGAIDWRMSAREIDANIRSLVRPYSGAYTFYRDRSDALQQLYIWKSHVVSTRTKDLGVPGHVIRNDPHTGHSHVFTGQGIIALEEVSHGSAGTPFGPGRTWKSIRMRLGLSIEDEIFRLNRTRDPIVPRR